MKDINYPYKVLTNIKMLIFNHYLTVIYMLNKLYLITKVFMLKR